ncbi:MFS transporter [Kribbella sancticallisti]|uniref:MFS transporter n=1 Tax=Kribbella sancticallisti TaxID=460087 RepID=A0ABP4PIT2_9ACTN
MGALALTQTVGWGVLYYVFGVFLEPMSVELGISTATSAGAFSVAVLVSGVLSIPVGRWVDAHGAHLLMTAGSLLASVGVVVWSQVQTVPQLYAVFVLIGAASAMVLYGPAFAVLVAVLEPRRRAKGLLAVTLAAGLASTIFIPLSAWLIEGVGWRDALVILGLGHNLITVPLHGIVLWRTEVPKMPAGRRDRARDESVRRALRDPGFWMITAAFVFHGAAVTVVAVHLVLFLMDLGYRPTVAAGLTGLLGICSISGRLVISALGRWLDESSITARLFLLQGIAIAALPIVGDHPLGAAVCIDIFGLGFGVAAITTPAILISRYGADRYATVAGVLSTPTMIARAFAPLGGALLAVAVGYRMMMIPVAVVCFAAGICLSLSRRLPVVR